MDQESKYFLKPKRLLFHSNKRKAGLKVFTLKPFQQKIFCLCCFIYFSIDNCIEGLNRLNTLQRIKGETSFEFVFTSHCLTQGYISCFSHFPKASSFINKHSLLGKYFFTKWSSIFQEIITLTVRSINTKCFLCGNGQFNITTGYLFQVRLHNLAPYQLLFGYLMSNKNHNEFIEA